MLGAFALNSKNSNFLKAFFFNSCIVLWIQFYEFQSLDGTTLSYVYAYFFSLCALCFLIYMHSLSHFDSKCEFLFFLVICLLFLVDTWKLTSSSFISVKCLLIFVSYKDFLQLAHKDMHICITILINENSMQDTHKVTLWYSLRVWIDFKLPPILIIILKHFRGGIDISIFALLFL